MPVCNSSAVDGPTVSLSIRLYLFPTAVLSTDPSFVAHLAGEEEGDVKKLVEKLKKSMADAGVSLSLSLSLSLPLSPSPSLSPSPLSLSGV